MEDLVLADRPVWLLLTIAVVAIAVLLFLIIKTRLHAFFSLLIVAVLTGLAAGIGVGDVIDVVIGGFSTTVGTVALLVGFGAVLGRLIEIWRRAGAGRQDARHLRRSGAAPSPSPAVHASDLPDAGFIVSCR